MITDFCSTLWDTRIESDAVCSDGYDVLNLISRNKFEKHRGFLAERFVKPVVSILVSFPFPVDVSVINVNPRVGCQKVCGIEILAAGLRYNQTNDKLSKYQSYGHDESNGSLFHMYKYSLNVNNIKKDFVGIFHEVLRVKLAENKVGHFRNHCFQQKTDNDFDSKIIKDQSCLQSCNLKHGQRLHNTSHLWICITQVHNSSIPCLGALEVIGRPAKNNSTFVINFSKLITTKLQQEIGKLLPSSKHDTREKNQIPQIPSKVDTKDTSLQADAIPLEFIDPITFNIMSMPVLLPSGNTVDNTTLEKHIKSESSWGRQPSDPFTGLPIRTKIVPNISLKYRIDKYILSSQVNVDDLGRTVGSLSDFKSTVRLKYDAICEEDKVSFKRKQKTLHSIIEHQPKRLNMSLSQQNKRIEMEKQQSSLDETLDNLLRQNSTTTSTRMKTSSLVQSFSGNLHEGNNFIFLLYHH